LPHVKLYIPIKTWTMFNLTKINNTDFQINEYRVTLYGDKS